MFSRQKEIEAIASPIISKYYGSGGEGGEGGEDEDEDEDAHDEL